MNVTGDRIFPDNAMFQSEPDFPYSFFIVKKRKNVKDVVNTETIKRVEILLSQSVKRYERFSAGSLHQFNNRQTEIYLNGVFSKRISVISLRKYETVDLLMVQ